MNSCFGCNYISVDEQDPIRVLMTGFAPFGGIETNPSWEGVISMNKEEIESKYQVYLFREKVDVRYNDVDLSVPKLWDKLQPHLTIHVGVSEAAPCLVLETQACKCGYELGDQDGLCPANNMNGSGGPEVLSTELDVEVLCKEFNRDPPADGLEADISHDAGRYLCEYIYYTSLCRGTSKTLFVHVPLDKYSPEQIARGLERILEICIGQITSMSTISNF